MYMEDKKTSRKLTAAILLLILLSICLCLTTVALVLSTLSVEQNLFRTGLVKINLNDGKPIVEAREIVFEPGMTMEKEFFIENNSTGNVYFKLYFGNVGGSLADVVEITICDGEKVLYQGTANALNRKQVAPADDELKIGERRTLTIRFHFPEAAGNAAQNQMLSFDLCADAVQTKNNPDRLFD